MTQEEIDALVVSGAIERVQADPETARVELEQAQRHVRSATAIAGSDPSAAFALAYDAIRKALSAHMRHRGYRVTKGPAHHVRTGRYALAALDAPHIQDDIDVFDDLRQLRNQSEYDAATVHPDDVQEALTRADAILDAVEHALHHRS